MSADSMAKKVNQYDFYTGELIAQYDTIEMAAHDNFITRQAIKRALKRDGRMSKLKLWFKFASDDRSLNIKLFQREVYENAIEHGRYEPNPSFAELIALCHAELSEALEEYRKGLNPSESYLEDGIVKGIPSELADVVLLVLSMSEHFGIDIESAIQDKHEYNKTRAYKHNKNNL